jgi:hypothetical protein
MGPSCSAPGAWRAFFEGDFSLTGAQSPPTDLAMLRVVQDAGWLGPRSGDREAAYCRGERYQPGRLRA